MPDTFAMIVLDLQPMMRRLLPLLLLLLVTAPVLAQGGDPKEQLLKELWCPICNGIRLDVCEQKVCEQMRAMIDQELASGKTPEQIKAQFIDLYGPVVLGEPPREGFNLIAWIMPVVLLIGGITAAVLITRRRSPQAMPVPAAPAASVAATDPYLARVDRELADE
jgi:cytochrome c-type biogenesis protein CcmH